MVSLKNEEGAHARLGPSSAHRWLRCPASINLSQLVPPRPAGKAAQAGTVLHSVYERRLQQLGDFRENELEQLLAFDWSEKRSRQTIDQALTATYTALEKYGLTEFLTEMRVDPGTTIGRSDFWGTADLVSADVTNGVLLVGDLKTGRGKVDVDFNDQLMSYAVGCLELLDFEPKRVVLGIFQPPVSGSHPALWETDFQTLKKFSDFAKHQAFLTDQIGLPPSPSAEACLWCQAKSVCPAQVRADICS